MEIIRCATTGCSSGLEYSERSSGVRYLYLLLAAAGLSSAATLVVGEGEEYLYPQDAFDAVADGDTVLIRSGTYSSFSSIELLRHSDVHIQGEEETSLICRTSSANVIWLMNCDRITVRGLSMTHTEPSDGISCNGNVIGIDSCNDITIEGCDINGCGAIGVYTCICDDITLRENFIHNNSVCAVEFMGQRLYAETMMYDGLVMENNIIFSNGDRYTYFDEYVIGKGAMIARFAGSFQDEDLRFVFHDPETSVDDTLWIAQSCDDSVIDLIQNPDFHMNSLFSVNWRDCMLFHRWENEGSVRREVVSVEALPEP
jgi:parallel beta-helix repeat protein